MKRFFLEKFMFLFLLVTLLQACGYKEGIIQKAEKSFLLFTGNTENISLSLDDSQPFLLKTYEGDNAETPKMLYQVLPGKHSIKVYRDGNVIVDRILFLGSQETMEVLVP